MFPKMVGFPNKPMGFPTENDQNLGCEMGVPPFKETPKWTSFNDQGNGAQNSRFHGMETRYLLDEYPRFA